MNTSFKDRIYDHEEMPPLGTWDRIASELDQQQDKVYTLPTNKKKPVYTRLAVAASIVLVILASVFYLNNKNEPAAKQENQGLSSTKVPEGDKRYIIVTSPSGQKIKISAKFSNYIGALYQNSNENPDWYKKFSEWREIMQNKPLTPTTPNFLDVIEMSDFLEKAD